MQDKLIKTLPPSDSRRRAAAMRSVLSWNEQYTTETGRTRGVETVHVWKSARQ